MMNMDSRMFTLTTSLTWDRVPIHSLNIWVPETYVIAKNNTEKNKNISVERVSSCFTFVTGAVLLADMTGDHILPMSLCSVS
jgi:hypothetical protein